MERFIPVEIFRKKSNTFRGITVLPFLPKRPKFSVPFVFFVPASVSVPKKKQYHLTKIFPESSAQMVSALGLAVTCDNFENYPYFELFLDITQFNRHRQTQILLGARKYVPCALLNDFSYFSTDNDSMTFQARKMKFYKFHDMHMTHKVSSFSMTHTIPIADIL